MNRLCILVLFSSICAVLSHTTTSGSSLKYDPVRNFAFLKDPQKRSNGEQPLFVSFEAFGKTFSFEVKEHEYGNIWDERATIQTWADGELVKEEHPPQYEMYQSDNLSPSKRIMLITFPNGDVSASILQDGEFYFIEPLSHHAHFLDADHHKRLSEESRLVMYSGKDIEGFRVGGKECGHHSDDEHKKQASTQSEQKVVEEDEEQSKRLKPIYPARWTNCYSNQAQVRALTVGIGVSYGFYTAVGASNVNNIITSTFALANDIYFYQLGVVLKVGSTQIQSASGSNPSWNTCPTNINTLLDYFTAWADPRGAPEGIWHLFTNCYPPPGTVGLAWVGTLCDSSSNSGISSLSSEFWLTVAHEIGHNFAASHTFQEGQGKTGGIMDYGDGTLYGLYQFNTKYSKAEICGEIQRVLNRAGCFTSYTTSCGNGIVEYGEDCDDTSACCSGCKFTAGSSCSGNTQCCSNCKIRPTSQSCTTSEGISGYCGAPECITPESETYSNTAFCSIQANKPCLESLRINGGNCVSGDTTTPKIFARDGTVCNATDANWRCKSGGCLYKPIWDGAAVPLPPAEETSQSLASTLSGATAIVMVVVATLLAL